MTFLSFPPLFFFFKLQVCGDDSNIWTHCTPPHPHPPDISQGSKLKSLFFPGISVTTAPSLLELEAQESLLSSQLSLFLSFHILLDRNLDTFTPPHIPQPLLPSLDGPWIPAATPDCTLCLLIQKPGSCTHYSLTTWRAPLFVEQRDDKEQNMWFLPSWGLQSSSGEAVNVERNRANRTNCGPYLEGYEQLLVGLFVPSLVPIQGIPGGKLVWCSSKVLRKRMCQKSACVLSPT